MNQDEEGGPDQDLTAEQRMLAAVGGPSMLNAEQRTIAIAVLKRIGMVQTMTVKEKYEKAFETLTMTPEEIEERDNILKEELKKKPKLIDEP